MVKRYALLAILIPAMAVGKAPTSESNFRTVRVANRMTIEVPSHWEFLKESSRRNLAAAADGLMGSREPNHVASLAVTALPAPAGAIVRVSVVDGEDLSQKEFIGSVKSDPSEMNKLLTQIGDHMITDLRKQIAPTGIEILGGAKTSVEVISGKLAIAVAYRRTSALQPDITFHVTQYHVPLGDEKLLITLSYREQDSAVYASILRKVKSSIRID